MKTLKTISTCIDRFWDILFYIPIAMMALLLAICAATVFLRGLLTGMFNWSDEAMRYLMVYSTFLAMPMLVAKKKNITIDLTDVFFAHNPKGQKMFLLLCEILCLAGNAILIPVSVTFLKANMVGYSSAMHIPMWIIYSCLPIGFTLSTVAGLNNIIKMTVLGEDKIC